MADKIFYRFYLNETLRKHLGINIKNKKIYIFKVNHTTYLSTDVIPTHLEFHILKVTLGKTSWFLDIPNNLLDYEPVSYKLLNTRGKVIQLLHSV